MEKVCKAFAVLMVRAVQSDVRERAVEVFDRRSSASHIYAIDASLFTNLKEMTQFVYIAATVAHGVRA